MSDIARLHRRALDATRNIVVGIESDQMALPTPDEAWDVRALLNHLISGNLWAAELAGGHTIEEVGDRLDGDIVGDDPLGAYDRSAKAASAAFEAPGALDAPCAVSYGPVPGSIYAGHRSSTSSSTDGTWPPPPATTPAWNPTSSTPAWRLSSPSSTCSKPVARSEPQSMSRSRRTPRAAYSPCSAERHDRRWRPSRHPDLVAQTPLEPWPDFEAR